MLKILNIFTNKKATILPVTIVAMFIMIVVAYTCIKMFLVQNIMSTTDQLKVRTFYAAEAIMEKQKTAIYYMIDNQNVNNNTNIDTNMGNEEKKEICKITKINGASDANFASENFSTQNNYKNRRDNAKYPADSEFGGDDNARMYPQVYGYSKIMKYAPNSWLKDCGISFYKKKGVTISDNDLYHKNVNIDLNKEIKINNENYLKLDRSVYYNVVSSDGLDAGCCKTWFDNNRTDWIAFIDITGKAYNDTSAIIDDKMFMRLPRNNGASVESVINPKLNDAKLNRRSTYHPPSVYTISFCTYTVGYFVKNSSQGYVITSEAGTEVGTKISAVTSRINLYFDVFMTKLYRVFIPQKVYSCTWQPPTPPLIPVGYWTDWVETTPSHNPIPIFFDKDTNRSVNNIKFHIQKWEEVVS